MVAVDRSAARHTIKDLNVSTTLRGDFAAAHLTGDNSHVLTTDTQKNTVFAFARDGVGEIEDFGLRLARHLAGAYPWITGARVEIEEYGWDRIAVGGRGHDHAFSRSGGETRTAVVTVDSGQEHVLSGLSGLVVLKTTGSAFAGFPRGPLHHAGRDRRPDPGHRGHRPLAAHRGPRLGRQRRRHPGRPPGVVREPAQRGPAADAVPDGRGRAQRPAGAGPRSGCRCPTSTTSCRT